MEVFGAVAAAFGVLDESRQVIDAIRGQRRHMKETPDRRSQVELELDEINKMLRELERCKHASLPEMGVRQVESISDDLRKVKEVLEKEKSKEESASCMRRFFRARRGPETLDELIECNVWQCNVWPSFPSYHVSRAPPAVTSHHCKLYKPPGFILGVLQTLGRNCAQLRPNAPTMRSNAL